jgi:hypothetical protein
VSDDDLALIPLSCGIGLFPGVCVPLTRMAASVGVARNRVAGIRTRHTQASEAAGIARRAAPSAVVDPVRPPGAQDTVQARCRGCRPRAGSRPTMTSCLSSTDSCQHSTHGGGEAAQLMVGTQVPEKQQRLLAAIAWASFGVSTALTLVLLDWRGAGAAKPLWAFALPTASGIVGGIAGFRAQQELLGAVAVAFGSLCVPVAIFVVGALHGP